MISIRGDSAGSVVLGAYGARREGKVPSCTPAERSMQRWGRARYIQMLIIASIDCALATPRGREEEAVRIWDLAFNAVPTDPGAGVTGSTLTRVRSLYGEMRRVLTVGGHSDCIRALSSVDEYAAGYAVPGAGGNRCQ